jgi:hypothetical protein
MYRTNPGTEADATLMLTVSSSILKSSLEDLTRPTFCIALKQRFDQKTIGTKTPAVRGEYRRLPAWILTSLELWIGRSYRTLDHRCIMIIATSVLDE